MSDLETIELAHARVGMIKVREEEVLHFDGLPGFPEAHRFALVAHEASSAFSWLACLDDPELAFVVTDPKLFFPDYAPTPPERALGAVGATRPDEVLMIAIVNLLEEQPLVNLAAPLLVHPGSRRAVQAILDDECYSTRELLAATPAQTESKPQT